MLYRRVWWLWCVLALLARTVLAGGGPTGLIVLYNPGDPVSLTMASHYQQVRGIPERNMVPISLQSGYSREQGWALVEQLRSTLKARGVEEQLQAIALAGTAPLNSGYAIPSGTLSFQSFLYLSPNYSQTQQPAGNDLNAGYRATPYQPAAMLDARTVCQGKTYWPISQVAPTNRLGLSPTAAMAAITRAKMADASAPRGVIYWPLNGDVRSTTREWEIAEVRPVWDQLQMPYSIIDGVWVRNRSDILGGVVGIASTEVVQGNQYLPGAWIDHLTSCGGFLDSPAQMKCTDWLAAGADGSAGTMAEPYAIAGKFPHAHIHTYLRQGASLAEAFWESIQLPREIICVGDPLMQPFAHFPKVMITAPTPGATLKGTVNIRAVATGELPLLPSLDLFVDGRRLRCEAADEPVKAIRTPNGFTLDTTTLTDGWHELRVVASNADPVRTQGEAVLPILVSNTGKSVELQAPARVLYDRKNAFSATVHGMPDITTVELRACGRTLAPLPVGVVVDVVGEQFPFAGRCTVRAVATLPDGREISSTPITLETIWVEQTATTAPVLGRGLARLRIFPEAAATAFAWETPAAEGEIEAAGDRVEVSAQTPCPGIVENWAKIDYAKKPGIELSLWVAVPANAVYEFGAPTDRVNLREWAIDGTRLLRGKNGLYGPVALQAGWHLFRLRALPGNTNFAVEIWLRGGPFVRLAPLPKAWCAAPVLPGTPAPRITSLQADGKTVDLTAPRPVTLTGNQLSLTMTADGAGPLTTRWTVGAAPIINNLDGLAPVSFTTNERATVATFSAAGHYLLRALVSDGTACAIATVPVEIVPTATSVNISPVAARATVAQGIPLDCGAFLADQFGRRMPAQPPLTWSIAPAGTLVSLSRESVRMLPAAQAGEYRLTAVAGGKTGTLAVQVTPSKPPEFKRPPTVQVNSPDQKSIRISMEANDPDDARGLYLRYRCAITSQPAGSAATVDETSTVGRTGQFVLTPRIAGTYVVRCAAVEQAGGGEVTATLQCTMALTDDGKLVLAPTEARVADCTVPVGRPARMSVAIPGATYPLTIAWETSMDGTQWAVLREYPNQFVLALPAVTAKENGLHIRARVSNAAGAVISNVATLTVNNPPHGVIDVQPERGAYGVSEMFYARTTDEALVVTMVRNGETAGKVSVQFATRDGNILPGGKPEPATDAKDGIHYRGVAGTLTWEDGEAGERLITIPLIHDEKEKPAGKRFTLAFTNPTGGLVIVKEQWPVIIIQGNVSGRLLPTGTGEK